MNMEDETTTNFYKSPKIRLACNSACFFSSSARSTSSLPSNSASDCDWLDADGRSVSEMSEGPEAALLAEDAEAAPPEDETQI